MANLNKQLRELFHAYLDRINSPKIPVRRESYRQPTLFDQEFTGVIYFYEWSDVTRTPRSFYTLKKFEEFLSESQIFIMGYQREIIKNMHNPYITCRKGTKELVIKPSYETLKASMNATSTVDTFNNFMAKGSESTIRRPMMYEPEGRWQDENEFQWYG